MIEVLKSYENPDREAQITDAILEYYDEARALMPEIPADIRLYFYKGVIVTGYAAGGFAYAPATMTIGFDDTYPNESEKWKQLRGSVLHEAYHFAQGFTEFDAGGEKNNFSALENCIFEGAASVFERDHAGVVTGWSEYLDEATMTQYVQAIKQLGEDYDIQKWKFYDSDTDTKWILYRTGTFIVDRALARSGLSIIDIRNKSAEEILALANL